MSTPEKQVRRVTWVGLWLNLVLTLAKFFTGVFCASHALIADAVHSVSDMATDVAVLVGVRFWSAPPDRDHPYGHARIETLVTALIGFMLAGAGIAIGWDALLTLHDKTLRAPRLPAFFVAVISILAKEWCYRWTDAWGRRVSSTALRANAWHHRTDSLSSIPVAVAILVSSIFPSWDFLDAVGAFLVSLFILYAAYKIVMPALLALTDASTVDPDTIKTLVMELDKVCSVHAVRARSSGSSVQVDLHVMVDGALTVYAGHEVAASVKYCLLQSDLGISDVVVHIEPYGGHAVHPKGVSE